MNSNITISPALPPDALGIQKVLRDSSRAMYLASGYSEEDFENRFRDSLSDSSVGRCAENLAGLSSLEKYVVARDVPEIVGLCYGEKTIDRNILHALYVYPKNQGQGIGKKLWDSMTDFFDPTKSVVLDVFVCNTPAIEFYKRLGFVDTGKRHSDESFKSKSGVEIIEMEMDLSLGNLL